MNKKNFDLERFISAQEGVYPTALQELRSSRKKTHWMWFVFPQIDGLGFSAMAAKYAIHSLDEARAYLGHPVLGPRLDECCQALIAVNGRTASEIMGYPDDLKLRSCLTLFEQAAPGNAVFGDLLAKYYGGERDERTLEIVKTPSGERANP